jgi:PKHD-type hydroxylase
MEWAKFHYYDTYSELFTPDQCNSIIESHLGLTATNSIIHDYTGTEIRNTDVFWLHRVKETAWIFDALISVVQLYNKDYCFDTTYECSAAQLSRYKKDQKYDWHMDLGSKNASRRKISVVVELTPLSGCVGGGVEIFYGDKIDNTQKLKTGDAIIFPSFVMHRAAPVVDGTRWSLVSWFLGDNPFR